MTFNPSVPLNSNPPGLFPAQNQANMSVLNANIARDHQFNNTPNSIPPSDNTGYHNLIHKTIQSPSGALASTGRSYVKVSAGRVHDFYMDNTGTEYQITPTMPIRASVNFNSIGITNGNPCTLRSFYNVTSVIKDSIGNYTVNFPTMPNANYIIQITGMRNSNLEVHGYVLGNATYSSSVSTTFIKIQFLGGSSSPVDVLMGNVTIFSTI